MTENDLNAEYRALVRQLHEQTISTVVEVDIWWNTYLFREVVDFTSRLPDEKFDYEKIRARSGELQDELQRDIDKKLLFLAYGHPDPDVRRAADVLSNRLFFPIMYYDTERAKRKDGQEATTAVHLVHKALEELRRAAYHAPFRETRPNPEFDGNRVIEELPSKLVDAPHSEF